MTQEAVFARTPQGAWCEDEGVRNGKTGLPERNGYGYERKIDAFIK